jgi:hypothetical protein
VTRVWDPSIDFLKEENLEDGLKEVLNFLNKNLSNDWEFYTKPFLNGFGPDILLLNENFGIQLIVFKEEEIHPLSKLNLVREEILNYYIPNVSTENFGRELVTLSFASPFISKEEAKGQLEDRIMSTNLYRVPAESSYFSIISKEDLADSDNEEAIAHAVPFSNFKSSKYMNKEIADALRYHVRTSDFILEDHEALKINMLDEHQQKLILTRTKSGFRRIRGSSGSGKTLVLAGKVVDLYKQGKSVLFLSYNKTLVNLVESYYKRFKKGDEELDLIKKRGTIKFKEPIFNHYMRYAKRIFYLQNKPNTWKDFFNDDKNSGEHDGSVGDKTIRMTEVLSSMVKKSSVKKYDAILIDEGQDFLPEWWDVARQLLNDNGEAYFVIDEAQDIYGNVKSWTDSVMKNSGFTGRATLLKTSYRLPKTYIPFVRSFIEKFQTDESKDLLKDEGGLLIPESSSQLELGGLEKCYLSWEQIDAANKEIAREKGIERCTKLVLDILPNLVDNFTYNNITLLCSSHESGKKIVDNLKKENILSAHVFDDEKRTQDANKMNFFLSKNKVKISTVHSFKGFESPLIVYFMERGTTFEEAYTALTRSRLSVNNECHLKVVCNDPRFISYGETWNPPKGEEWLKVE